KAPKLSTFVEATYPEALLKAGIGDEVVLIIDIDAQGAVVRVELVSAAHPDFAQAAMTAVAAFLFVPAEVDGAASAIRLEYRYVFPAPEPEPVPVSQVAPTPPPINPEGRVREARLRGPIT